MAFMVLPLPFPDFLRLHYITLSQTHKHGKRLRSPSALCRCMAHQERTTHNHKNLQPYGRKLPVKSEVKFIVYYSSSPGDVRDETIGVLCL
jgi:hypothetical protein